MGDLESEAMTTSLNPFLGICEYVRWIMTLSDPRTRGWFMIDSPGLVFFCILFYVCMAYIGPDLMKNRQPLKLKLILKCYNFAMAMLNFYIFFQVITASYRLRYRYMCQPCVQSFHPDELQIADAMWWYYFSKVIEFSDTLFFILRKKNNQLSFLHVYHHATMLFFCWIGAKWFPTGSSFILVMVNSGVHVVMYTYYGLATFGPKISKYLWWKKYLTILQMLQFVALIFFAATLFMHECNFPLWTYYIGSAYMISFIVLFGNFYKKEYAKQGNQTSFLRMDLGCGQGHRYDEDNYSSVTSNHKDEIKTE